MCAKPPKINIKTGDDSFINEVWQPCPVPKYTLALDNGTDVTRWCSSSSETNCPFEKICSRVSVCKWNCVDACPDGKIGTVQIEYMICGRFRLNAL